MELVKLTHENLEREHICCAISGNKDIQVMSKKNWLKDRLDEGKPLFSFLFTVLDARFQQQVRVSMPLELPGYPQAVNPCFRDSVGRQEDMPEGFVLYYTNQCPFTAKYVPILEEMAKARNAVFRTSEINDSHNSILIDSKECVRHDPIRINGLFFRVCICSSAPFCVIIRFIQ